MRKGILDLGASCSDPLLLCDPLCLNFVFPFDLFSVGEREMLWHRSGGQKDSDLSVLNTAPRDGMPPIRLGTNAK